MREAVRELAPAPADLSGEPRRALVLIAQAETRKQAIFGVSTTDEHWLLGALIAAAVHSRSTWWWERRRMVRIVRGATRRLAECAAHCPHSVESHYWLAAAESARITSRDRPAIALERYGLAAMAARRARAPGRQAMALELAACLARTGEADCGPTSEPDGRPRGAAPAVYRGTAALVLRQDDSDMPRVTRRFAREGATRELAVASDRGATHPPERLGERRWQNHPVAGLAAYQR